MKITDGAGRKWDLEPYPDGRFKGGQQAGMPPLHVRCVELEAFKSWRRLDRDFRQHPLVMAIRSGDHETILEETSEPPPDAATSPESDDRPRGGPSGPAGA